MEIHSKRKVEHEVVGIPQITGNAVWTIENFKTVQVEWKITIPRNKEKGRVGLVVRSRLWIRRAPGSKPDSTEDPTCVGPVARYVIRSGQTSSRWCGVKIPALARPTQKGCKAGRGPERRPPPACGGRYLLGTIKKNDTGIVPEQGQ
ncbi:hypothetical protein AVEN_5263-1 [Araneus ventricosus]|uniref:Uncharacterized protein n=1 Tax=Araneus ventricosus TaxID=182803 RepID=A0A4Y2CTL1_ARAVE|nr:hypothetical protein AVEN_5263-1 [Araneus ventricosus]